MDHKISVLSATVTALAVGIVAFYFGRRTAAAPAIRRPEPHETNVYSDNSDSDDDSSEVEPGVELKMVICVRSDLNMSKGKIAAQVGHAVLSCYRQALNKAPHYVKAWLHRAQGKIALKCDDEPQMNAIAAAAREAGLPCVVIEDAGRTEVEPGTHTVCGIGPAPKHLIDQITGPKGSIPLRCGETSSSAIAAFLFMLPWRT